MNLLTVEGITKTFGDKKIFDGIKEACYEFDLSEPMWFDSNIADFKRHSKVRFTSDNFIDDIDFSYMEVQVIEED